MLWRLLTSGGCIDSCVLPFCDSEKRVLLLFYVYCWQFFLSCCKQSLHCVSFVRDEWFHFWGNGGCFAQLKINSYASFCWIIHIFWSDCSCHAYIISFAINKKTPNSLKLNNNEPVYNQWSWNRFMYYYYYYRLLQIAYTAQYMLLCGKVLDSSRTSKPLIQCVSPFVSKNTCYRK